MAVSFQDRPYYGEPRQFGYEGGRSRFASSLGLPPLTRMVKYLMMINGVVFLLQMMVGDKLVYWFAAMGQPWTAAVQVWRLLSFQFLHGGFLHLLFNMMGLYFFGTTLERIWGSKKFLSYYLTCGAVGGLIYVIASVGGYFGGSPLIGASGGVLGLLAACAVMFPQMKVILFPIPLPVPIRVLTLFITAGYTMNVLRQGMNAGGDVCHLGGMATGFMWLMTGPYWASWRQKRQKGAFGRKLQQQRNHEEILDQILDKVHREGIHSLTREEKRFLQQETEWQKQHDTRT